MHDSGVPGLDLMLEDKQAMAALREDLLGHMSAAHAEALRQEQQVGASGWAPAVVSMQELVVIQLHQILQGPMR
jgi:putative heme iron utilization protein